MKIYFPELTFNSAHYIPGHETCGSPHGHTYFVRNLTVDVSMCLHENEETAGITIDFGELKQYIRSWHHRNIIPRRDYEAWKEFYDKMGWRDNLLCVDFTSAEFIAEELKVGLLAVLDRAMMSTPYKADSDMIHFELWEGPNQAVKV